MCDSTLDIGVSHIIKSTSSSSSCYNIEHNSCSRELQLLDDAKGSNNNINKLQQQQRRATAWHQSQTTAVPPTNICVMIDEYMCVVRGDFTSLPYFLCVHIFATNKKQQHQSVNVNSERGITILAKNLAVMRDGVKINIMDTPGYV